MPLPRTITVLLLALCASFGFASSAAPSPFGKFDTESDLFLAQFDSKTDVDDIHSVAAIATMLADPRFDGVRHHAVAGAYGRQDGPYVPANELFEAAFGEHWSDAHGDYEQALSEVTGLVTTVLEAGGRVWIAEAGQSDLTAALLRNIQAALPAISTEDRVHVVQHSEWNENSATPQALAYVKAHASYHKIPDGNMAGNGSPGLTTDEPADWRSSIREPALVNIWELALNIANRYNGKEGRYTNPSIASGGMDFSDVSEACWIFGFEDLADVEAFFETFATEAP